MVGVRTDDLGATMIDDVREILWFQSEINRNQHSTNLRYRIVRFQVRVGIRCDIGNAIALRHSECLQ